MIILGVGHGAVGLRFLFAGHLSYMSGVSARTRPTFGRWRVTSLAPRMHWRDWTSGACLPDGAPKASRAC